MVLHILMRTIGVFVVASVCILSVYKGTSLFTWHPVLMSVGFILLMSEALNAYTSNSFLARGMKYNQRLTLHWLLQLGAASLIGLAFYSIYTHKNNNNYEHFKSSHGSLGLTTLLMLIGSTSGGIAARYSQAFKKSIKPAYLKIIHSIAGISVYALAINTFILGLESDWFRSQSTELIVYLLKYATILVAFLALIKPFISILKKLRNSFKSKD